MNDLIYDIAQGPDNPTDNASYYRMRLAQQEFRRTILNVMGRHHVDALVFPDVQVLPPTSEELEGGRWTALTFPTNTVIASQSGLPAISIPAGFSELGLPVGMELMGSSHSEATLLKIAYAYHKVANPRKSPPID